MSIAPRPADQRYRIGGFELDLRSGELRKDGARVPLQDLPLRLLGILAGHAGQVVTRDEIQRRLWPDKTYADFEDGVHTAIRKLRQALDDDPREPRCIETARGYGYRLLGPVELVVNETPPIGGTADPAEPEEVRPLAEPSARRVLPRWLVSAMAGVTVLSLLVALWWLSPLPPPAAARLIPVTTSGGLDFCLRIAMDGTRLFYLDRSNGRYRLMQASMLGGDARPVPSQWLIGSANTTIFDTSPDGKRLLAGTFEFRGDLMPLWTIPVDGGPPARLGTLSAQAAVWSRAGDAIAFSRGHELWTARSDGSEPRLLATLPHNVEWPAWSPDDRRLRFTVFPAETDTSSIWEIGADGHGLHQLLVGWSRPSSERFGTWSADGQYFVFTGRHEGRWDIWAVRERSYSWRRSPTGPFRLTAGPLTVLGAMISPNNRYVYYYGDHTRLEMVDFDPATRRIEPFLADLNPAETHFSRDNQWMTFTNAESTQLWRSRASGDDRLRLLPSNIHVGFPRWSPDGQRIAFTSETPGRPAETQIIDRDGGAVEPILPQRGETRDPDWSPDGTRVVLVRATEPSSNAQEIAIVDVRSHLVTPLPESNNLWGSRWSPDGRFIAASSGSEIKVFDLQTRRWRVLGRGKAIGIGVWSLDGAYLYFQDLLGTNEPLFRARPDAGASERVADFAAALTGGATRCGLISFAPNGHLLMSITRAASDLFAVELK
jgi:Tol biopolymer transport system component/DNA-binding winged helix-turn-helix (wHTH) protein